MKLRMLVIALAVVLIPLVPLNAEHFAPVVSLPADLQGELEGVPYRILVPENWNGTLLVYAHGYSEERTPPLLAPLTADVDTLFGRGFALAASRFAGSGWNVKEGLQNTVVLTAAFRHMVGRPHRTIIWGKSMGGLMALGLIERCHSYFDGAVALCPPAAGTPRRFDQALDIALAYEAVFGWESNWGTPGDLRDDLNFTIEVWPHIQAHMNLEPFKGGWEFIRRVNRMPPDTYYVGMNRVMPVYFATGVRAELESRADGPVSANIGRVYTLTDQDKFELAGMGVNADALLEQMNAKTTVTARRHARAYVKHYFDPSGRLTRPVLTLHTEGDALATPNHEGAYRATVEHRGNGDLLMQQFVKGGSHCSFNSAQDIAAIDAMVYWLKTRNRPDPSVFFPPALGFDPSYVPPAWPWRTHKEHRDKEVEHHEEDREED